MGSGALAKRGSVEYSRKTTYLGGRKTKGTYKSVILDKPQQIWNIVPSLLWSGSYYEDLKEQFKSNDKSYYRSQLP